MVLGFLGAHNDGRMIFRIEININILCKQTSKYLFSYFPFLVCRVNQIISFQCIIFFSSINHLITKTFYGPSVLSGQLETQ